MIISFTWTAPALLAGRKTVTRRQWKPLHLQRWQDAWEQDDHLHAAWDYLPRVKHRNGRHIATIRLTCRPRVEPLSAMPESDLEAEGDYWINMADYADGRPPDTELAVVRFSLEAVHLTDAELQLRLAEDRRLRARVDHVRRLLASGPKGE